MMQRSSGRQLKAEPNPDQVIRITCSRRLTGAGYLNLPAYLIIPCSAFSLLPKRFYGSYDHLWFGLAISIYVIPIWQIIHVLY